LSDIDYLYESVDISILRVWLEKTTENQRKKRLTSKLDFSEVINYSYIGSQPTQKGKANVGSRQFKKWREKIMRELYPKFYANQPSFWDMMRKRGRSLKVD